MHHPLENDRTIHHAINQVQSRVSEVSGEGLAKSRGIGGALKRERTADEHRYE